MMSKKPGAMYCIVLMLATVGQVPAQRSQQHVTAWAYGCAFSGAKSVMIYMQNQVLFGPAGQEIHVPARATPEGALEFTFDAPAGPIGISYKVDGQECASGGGGLIVLPGHDRHVVVSMYPGTFFLDWHARKFFAGTLPGFPVSVSIVSSATTTCPDDSFPERAATIDDGAYYVGYVAGLHNFLKIGAGVGAARFETLYIRLPDAEPVRWNQYVRRDITIDDLQTLTKRGLNVSHQCVENPTGATEPFEP